MLCLRRLKRQKFEEEKILQKPQKLLGGREGGAETLIVALDVPSIEEARRLVGRLGERATFFKVGMELLFQEGGLAFARGLTGGGKKIFLDAKVFDIPRTVAAALDALDEIDATFVSVHSLSRRLLEGLAERRSNTKSMTKIVGITLLTSMDEEDLRALGLLQSSEEMVLMLAKQAMEVGGLDGLVASGMEVGILRERYPDAVLITPGIRPRGAGVDDQRRTTTAREAVVAGADYIVVGRAITRAEDPCRVVEEILAEIE